MPDASTRRTLTFIEQVICNPIGLLFIIGLIVVVVNILIGDSPDTPKPLSPGTAPLKSIDSDKRW